jgi:hypothetical protein
LQKNCTNLGPPSGKVAVPPERFAAFWELVRAALAPGGRPFLIDSLYSETSTASDHHLEGQEATTMKCRLNDGQEFHIVKVYYRPERLAARLIEMAGRQTSTQPPTIFSMAQPTPAIDRCLYAGASPHPTRRQGRRRYPPAPPGNCSGGLSRVRFLSAGSRAGKHRSKRRGKAIARTIVQRCLACSPCAFE